MSSYRIYQHRVIQYLKNEIWFRPKPSDIDGVGIFAIRDIPKGTDILVEFDQQDGCHFVVEQKKMAEVHPNIKKMWNDYWKHDEIYQHIFLPSAYKELHVFWLNHSDNPNCYFNEDYTKLITNREIKENEELTEDYECL